MVSEHGANEPAFDRGRVIAAGCGLYLAPLAGRGRRALARRVRGPLRESGPVERPPHPDPLHSPSQTGVNALMASGERAKKCRASSGSLVPQRIRKASEIASNRDHCPCDRLAPAFCSYICCPGLARPSRPHRRSGCRGRVFGCGGAAGDQSFPDGVPATVHHREQARQGPPLRNALPSILMTHMTRRLPTAMLDTARDAWTLQIADGSVTSNRRGCDGRQSDQFPPRSKTMRPPCRIAGRRRAGALLPSLHRQPLALV
jgi:hypothetical protein